MTPFAESNIASAAQNVARALDLLERHTSCDLPDPRLVGAAYAELLDAKGKLAAAAQLEELHRLLEEARIEAAQRDLGVAETERPSRLRLVTR